VVCRHHLFDYEDGSPAERALCRTYLAVCYFAVLSGFITQWAYGSRSLLGAGPIGQYYLRRIGRVAFMAWVSLIACMLIPAGTSSSGPGANDSWLHLDLPLWDWNGDAWMYVRCFTLTQTWGFGIWEVDWCPNLTHWTICSFLPA